MLAVRIALRYLFSKKSHGAVNIISLVATIGVAIASAAIVAILSVFNGFSQLASSKLSRLDPDLLVSPLTGKTFADADSLACELATIPGVDMAFPALTEQAFAIAGNRQSPVTLRGIPVEASRRQGLAEATIDGSAALDSLAGFPPAIVSVGVALNLSVRPGMGQLMGVYEPRRIGRINPANPMAAFTADTLIVSGVFQIEQAEYDNDFLILPLPTLRRLLDYTSEASAIELWLRPGASEKAVTAAVQRILGPDFRVASRVQQHSDILRLISIEKWITFAMLAFILIIASFNIISAISMLIVEKDANMEVMMAMGATRSMVSKIFMAQAWMVTVAGGFAGILIGALLSLAQQHFGFIKLQTSNPDLLSTNVYPVAVHFPDLVAVAAAILLVATAVSLAISPISRPR